MGGLRGLGGFRPTAKALASAESALRIRGGRTGSRLPTGNLRSGGGLGPGTGCNAATVGGGGALAGGAAARAKNAGGVSSGRGATKWLELRSRPNHGWGSGLAATSAAGSAASNASAGGSASCSL